MNKDSLGDRMKGYESAFNMVLPRRMPVILRLDGKAFHTLTRGMNKPFDDGLIGWMNHAGLELCKQIQGAKLAYIQSDEISILVHNYTTLMSEPWFGNEVQKMVSVSASIATMAFNDIARIRDIRGAMFDSRVFLLPESEVANYFLWREQDASRNSIQMVARSLYSHKECEHKNCDQLQEMIFQKGINWNNLPTYQKRGRCVIYQKGDEICHSGWIIDNEIPVWKGEDRVYIEKHLEVNE